MSVGLTLAGDGSPMLVIISGGKLYYATVRGCNNTCGAGFFAGGWVRLVTCVHSIRLSILIVVGSTGGFDTTGDDCLEWINFAAGITN